MFIVASYNVESMPYFVVDSNVKQYYIKAAEKDGTEIITIRPDTVLKTVYDTVYIKQRCEDDDDNGGTVLLVFMIVVFLIIVYSI